MSRLFQGKYYDHIRKMPLSDGDGCEFAEWLEKPGHSSSFSMHPEGFPVFLRPGELRALDEYSECDPYGVKENLQSPFHKKRSSTTIDLLRYAIPAETTTPRILDLACGEGHITAAIQQAFPSAEISALDGSLSAIATATRTCRGVDFAVANAYDPPYSIGYFDVVVCNNIWEHVPDPVRLLGAVQRVLREDGFLIVSTPSRYKLINLLRIMAGKTVSFQSPHHVTEYSVGQVIEQLSYANFIVKEIRGAHVSGDRKGVKGLILDRFFTPLISSYLRIVGSHHSLAQTVFFLARTKPGFRRTGMEEGDGC